MPARNVPTAAREVKSATRVLRIKTFLFNITEQPAILINYGWSADGLPIGLQIVDRRFDDRGVLRMAAAFERARNGAAPAT